MREDRLHALYVVIALLGLRRSEALGLQWTDVDLDDGVLAVWRGLHRIGGRLVLMDTKTPRSRRTIPLPAPVRLVLAAHQELQERERVELAERWPASGRVFTTNCSKAVKAALERSGVRPVRLHDFQHGCVSVLLGLGVPPRTAMDIAGHSTIEMTMNVYGHVTLEEKRDALNRLGQLFEAQK